MKKLLNEINAIRGILKREFGATHIVARQSYGRVVYLSVTNPIVAPQFNKFIHARFPNSKMTSIVTTDNGSRRTFRLDVDNSDVPIKDTLFNPTMTIMYFLSRQPNYGVRGYKLS